MSGWLADWPAAEKGSPRAVAENGVIECPQEAVEIQTLIAALRDPSAQVAVAAAEALARRPPALAVPALCTVVENKDGYFCPSTRVATVHALKSLLPPGQGGLVADAVRDSDASVSVAAIAALVERNDDETADILLGLLEDSTGFYVALTRRAAALGLAHLRRGHSGRVTALLQNESDPEVRKALGAADRWP
jgi:HEAT repeat protein